jgi:3-oxoacyl-[acyl-carrier protein] reductase
MDLHLDGARAMVCGASRGIGAAIATALADEGARLTMVARPSADLAERAKALAATAVPVDLSTNDGGARAVGSAVTALGGLDLLVVNSGGPPSGTFEHVDEDAWHRAVEGTLLMAIRVIGSALPHLRTSASPAIVIVLSSSVREPIPALITSNVLRPALAGLVKALAAEIPPIRINGVMPGRIDTDRVRSLDVERAAAVGVDVEAIQRQTTARIPLGRYGEPEEVGRVATFLLSPAASYITGTVVAVDGGLIRSLP